MAGLGGGLVSAAVDGPGDNVSDASCGVEDQGVEQSAELVDGDVDQAVRGFGAGRGSGCKERVSSDDQGGPAVPGSAAAVLVLVPSEAGFSGLERFLDAPTLTGDGDEVVQGNGLRTPAAVERQLTDGALRRISIQ